MISDDTKLWTLNESDRLAVAEGCFFSPRHGQDVCKFVESFCCLSKGRWAGQPIKLMQWQRKAICACFLGVEPMENAVSNAYIWK